MNIKRPLVFLFAAGMTLGLAACDSGSQGNSESPTPDGETGGSSSGTAELNLWSLNIGEFAEVSDWEPITATFSEQNSNIKITITSINYQDDGQKLTSITTADAGPDIIFEGSERIVGNYAREDLMADLSDLWETGGPDTAEGISSVSQLDGTYYMYPLSVAAHRMAINYDVFEAAGALQYVDEETRTWTTDNFVKTMEAVRDAAAAGTINVATPGIIYCGARGGDQGIRAPANNLYSDYYVNEDDTSYLANSGNNVKALKLLQDMMNSGSMSVNASFAAADELQAFANQTCVVSFCWNYSNYTQYAEQTQLIPFATAFPSDDSKPELEAAGLYGFGVFNSKDETEIEAAKKSVQFVCDDQITGIETAKTTGFFPVHADWGDVYASDADAETRASFALMSDYLGRHCNLTSGWTEQCGYWWFVLAEIMTTGADVQTAVDNFVQQADANVGREPDQRI